MPVALCVAVGLSIVVLSFASSWVAHGVAACSTTVAGVASSSTLEGAAAAIGVASALALALVSGLVLVLGPVLTLASVVVAMIVIVAAGARCREWPLAVLRPGWP